MKGSHLLHLSKYLAYILRHGSAQEGLQLDVHGFISLSEVERCIERRFANEYTQADLYAVLHGQGMAKKRFEYQDGFVRALYGHSQNVGPRIEYETCQPPTYLYHGTTHVAFTHIQIEGLRPMTRQYVHLSIEPQQAHHVALRKTSQPLILRVDAYLAYEQGIAFYRPEPSHYVCETVPPSFLSTVDP